ncbi:MAG: carbohydrate porin [Thiotrichales bacterium]|nr:carbohydrate porin [Thiotrichales bacterium]
MVSTLNQISCKQPFLSSVLLSVALLLNSSVYAGDSNNYKTGVTLIHQHSSNPSIQADTSLSADLGLYFPTENGHWHIHIEASTSPKQNGVASVIQDSNADSGSSLNNRNQGRIQVSELHYLFQASKQLQLTLGLVDATGYLDTANIMNDENQHFISVSLVNNPVIDFPDYVLGAALEYQITPTFSSRLFVSSTHGIADNNRRNYSNLFEMNDDEKGIFSGLEFGYSTEKTFINLGAWLHNGKHEALDNPSKNDLSNYGRYLSAGLLNRQHQFEARAGVANSDVSAASDFLALAYQYTTDNPEKYGYLGLGFSITGFSSKLALSETRKPKHAQTAEFYWRKPLSKYWSVTPSVQWFKNPIIESDSINGDAELLTANVRVHCAF